MRYTPKQMDNIKLLALQCFKRDEAKICLSLVKHSIFTKKQADEVIKALQQLKRLKR